MLGQFALVALLGARFDLGFGFGDFLQPLLAARQFLRDRHAIGNIRLIGGFGLRQKLSNFGLQLRLDFARMLVRERAVLAGIGVDLRAVQRDRPHPQQAHLASQKQNLDERRFDLFQKASAEGRNCVVIGIRLAATKRKATESYVARSSLRLENTPVA